MRCSTIQPTGVPVSKQKAFKGIPQRIGYTNIKNWHDALKCWEMLSHAKYLDVHSDGTNHYYRYIREENYSFLDKLKSHVDKSEFIQRYCDFTGFPNLKEVCRKINYTFTTCIDNIARNRNRYSYRTPYSIIDSGYDPTCSVGLEKAFPGSDLDKGYIILEGQGNLREDEKIINEFKEDLWNNLDQRIVSLNHPDTFPDVSTPALIRNTLNKYDSITSKIEADNQNDIVKLFAIDFITKGLLNPFSRIKMIMEYYGKIKMAVCRYEILKDSTITDPYVAAEFNRKFANKLANLREKEEAKNFAFFIETVESNLREHPDGKKNSIFDNIKSSDFVKNSNVTQQIAWKKRIDDGYLKSKLRNRENLKQDFNRMTIEDRYELIKDIIKYSSNDESSKFSKYFKNDDDVKDRYEPLLKALR